MQRLIGILGLLTLLGIAYLLSSNRQKIDRRILFWGTGLQLILALIVLGIPSLGFDGPLRFVFAWANDAVIQLIAFTDEGTRFIFGPLADPGKSGGFIFAVQVLPTIIFFSSFVGIAYHLGVMQKVIDVLAKVMQKTMGTSGAESLSAAANIFVGQTEAPLVVKPFLSKMTQSELMAVMTGGMATVAGGVLAAYVGLLKDHVADIAGHLLTASVLSAPAALVMAKLIIPETEKAETLGTLPKTQGEKDVNVIEAAARGAGDGVTLAINVGSMLLAFIALIALFNAILGGLGGFIGFENWGAGLVPEALLVEGKAQLSLQVIFGWFFAPLAWLMGIPWSEAMTAGALLGEKVAVNEFIAYLHLSQLAEQLSERTMIILSYALCGFANFSSIAIQIGGIGSIAPERRSDLAKLGIRAVIGGSLAAFMTATIAGILI